MFLHAEVKALQEQYGISYKDAAHRLYHAEILKLAALGEVERDISDVHDQLDHVIAEAVKSRED